MDKSYVVKPTVLDRLTEGINSRNLQNPPHPSVKPNFLQLCCQECSTNERLNRLFCPTTPVCVTFLITWSALYLLHSLLVLSFNW